MRRTPVAFLLFTLALGGPAAAQTGAEDEARAQFEAGVELFEAGQLEQASVAFARAYELRPSYKILYLVGKCENAQRHFAASLDAYTRYLAEAGDQIDAARKKEVSGEIDRLHALVGTIIVETPAEGATVYVDDERQGETPLRAPVFVDLGKRTVVVRKGAVELHREVVKIAGGQQVVVKVEVAGGAASADGPPIASPAAPADAPAAAAPTAPPADGGGAAGKRSRGLLIGGIAALAVGAGAGAMGGVFTAKRAAAIEDADAARTGPKDEYDAAKEDAETATGVMVAGFVGAGVFVAAGTVLLVLRARSGKKGGGAVSIRPAVGGIAVAF